MKERIYQIEVKLQVISLALSPASGWRVTVDIDPMERGKGGKHPDDKADRAQVAMESLRKLGVVVGEHDLYGRADIVADHPEKGRRILEVEGDSSRQPEQALYSALGQILLVWNGWNDQLRYGLAVPNTRPWRRQLAKIRMPVRQVLGLELYLTGANNVVTMGVNEEVSP